MPNNYTKPIEIRSGLNEGYQYFCDKEHPLARGNSGMVLLHRHIASVSIGRWLASDEIVHHIDHNKLNNDPSNLMVLNSTEHGQLHNPQTLGTLVCLQCGKSSTRVSKRQKYCSVDCRVRSTIKNTDISASELEADIWEYPYSKLTNKYGLSDVGIKKRAVSLGCKIPPPYYHNKPRQAREQIRQSILGY